MIHLVSFAMFALTTAALALPFVSPPLQEYYWSAAEPTDSRSPCPMLNSLANHGILPRNGRNITKETLINVLTNIVQLDGTAASILASQALPLGRTVDGVQQFDLSDLSQHNQIEHDASLSRSDAAIGDNAKFNSTIFDQIQQFYQIKNIKGTETRVLSIGDIMRYRKFRETQCANENPEYQLTFKGKQAALLEVAVLLLEFPAEKGFINADYLEFFFRNEKLPFDQGFRFHKVTFSQVAWLLAKLNFY